MDEGIVKRGYLNEKQDFIELLLYFWKNKLLVIIFSAIGLVSSLIFTSQLQDIYTAEATIITNSQTNNMTNIASRLSGFGAFSAFGGSTVNSKSSIANAIMKSREFYSEYFYDDDLPVIIAVMGWDKENNKLIYNDDVFDKDENKWLIKKPTVQQSHGYFLELFNIEAKDDGTLSFTVNHFSPHTAKYLLEKILKNINEDVGQSDINQTKMAIDFLIKRRSETNLVGMREVIAKMIEEQTKTLMLANISSDYVFSVIDPAVISESPSAPNKRIYHLFAFVISLFLSILYILIRRFFNLDKPDNGF